MKTKKVCYMQQSSSLGKDSIKKLLVQQAVPASVGVLVMSLNVVVDTIFVGHWIGATAIAAINIVLPISFFIAALGMAIGVGGSSILSRALGAGNKAKAFATFGNQISLSALFSLGLAVLGLSFADTLIVLFGGKGELFHYAKIYYVIILYGIPFLALAMMGNAIMRAEGKARFSMIAMIIPSVVNLVLDYILMKVYNAGMAGAAWATFFSYVSSFLFMNWFFGFKSELKISWSHLLLKLTLVKEIGSLGFVTLSRQAMVSLVYLLTNNILYYHGGVDSVSVYAIIGRMLMFVLFPVLGITQGALPIVSYNYGARQYQRVYKTIVVAMQYAAFFAVVIFLQIIIFSKPLAAIFTKDADVIDKAVTAMRWVFAATPIIPLQLIGAAYFQAIGKSLPALFLTLSRQGFFFIPLLLVLPVFFQESGVWMAFPLADILSTLLTTYFFVKEMRVLKR